jgi:beta-alanine--pyruvate transaminase
VQDIFEKDDIFNRAKNLAPYFQKGLFSLQDLESVDNIRGYGMMGGIDMKLNTKPGKAGYETVSKLVMKQVLILKHTGDCLIIAPQFICEEKHIDEIIDKLRTGITNYQKNQKN